MQFAIRHSSRPIALHLTYSGRVRDKIALDQSLYFYLAMQFASGSESYRGLTSACLRGPGSQRVNDMSHCRLATGFGRCNQDPARNGTP